jgi:hypothetical protein
MHPGKEQKTRARTTRKLRWMPTGQILKKSFCPKCMATSDCRGANLALRGDRIELPAPSDEEAHLFLTPACVYNLQFTV